MDGSYVGSDKEWIGTDEQLNEACRLNFGRELGKTSDFELPLVSYYRIRENQGQFECIAAKPIGMRAKVGLCR